jgi:hypothetical protein
LLLLGILVSSNIDGFAPVGVVIVGEWVTVRGLIGIGIVEAPSCFESSFVMKKVRSYLWVFSVFFHYSPFSRLLILSGLFHFRPTVSHSIICAVWAVYL